MYQYLRYIILTIILIALLIFAILNPTLNGMIIHKNDILECENTNTYYYCITCCEETANIIYGEAYYGTLEWNNEYNACWNKYCKTYSK
jgi:hypothetical protein